MKEMRQPCVSVVVPTANRPELLLRALDSVMKQTYAPVEIIVVVDGPSDAAALSKIQQAHGSIRMLQLSMASGASVARNAGLNSARSEWIAFLDDDDEWLPNKLELQMRAALRSTLKYPIVFSRVVVSTPRGRFLMPRRSPGPGQAVDEYLYCRKSLLPGEVFAHTSNLLVPRELCRYVEFRAGLRKWNDIDWLLRAGQVSGAGLEFVPEALSIWNTEDYSRPTISEERDWRYLFDWATNNRELFSQRAYAGVLLISVMHEAVKQGDRRAVRVLLKEALRAGEPDAIQGILFLIGVLAVSITPRGAYHWLKAHLRDRAPVNKAIAAGSPR
jgi:glycosyltransferase involved in cell wall biosynthesis